MKQYHQYKLLILSGLIAISFLCSCVKNRDGETDFSSLKPVVLIPEGGLATFANQSLNFPGTDAADTATFHVNFAATNVAPADVTVGIGVDQNAVNTVNNNGGLQYTLLPDSCYTFQASATVKKGNNYTPVPVIFYPIKIDPSKNYLLPISVKTAPNGATISGNYGTIYYHFIGNPLAGVYNWDWTRWNTQDGSGAPTGSSFVGHTTLFVPDNPTQIEVIDNYYIQPRFVLTFTNNNGVLSNFQLSINADDAKKMSDAGVNIIDGPHILVADPVNKVFQFQYAVFNGSAYRYMIDKFYK